MIETIKKVDKSNWPTCVYCKESIPIGLKLNKICFNCLGKVKKQL